RLLDGYNYVIKADDSKTTEIIVLGKRGEVTIPPRSDVAASPPGEVTVAPKAPPEVASVPSKPNESSSDAVGLCMSMGNVRLSRQPSRRRVISRTYTCRGDLAKNLKLVLDRERKETLDGLVRKYAPGGRVKAIEYECPEPDRCVVTVKY